MRPIVTRALTAALATAGAVWAIVLPTLTLGEVRSPSHAFAIPAPGGEVVIEATRLPQPVTAQPVRIAVRRITPRAVAPARTVVVEALARTQPPVASSRPVAPASKHNAQPVAQPVAQAVAQPAPTPVPAVVPQPQRAPEPVRTLASVPVPAADDESGRHKQHKDKTHKDKPKHEKARKDDVVPLEAAPPAADPVARAEPLEPVAAEADQGEPGQDESGEDDQGKDHGDHGKGHDKKK